MTYAFLGGALVLILGLIALYNGLVRGKNAVDEAWSGIAVQLKRRHDLVPNLINTVKGYASHEREVFTHLAEARAQSIAAGSQGIEATAAAENALSHALKSLFAVAEAYPELQASANFASLQQSLSELEEALQMARRYYNGTAREQNNRILQFPACLIASSLGFNKAAYFELDSEAEKAVPQVNF
ncbi:MAG: LemA family protein [Desulfovibrionaceae bacterium]|jgi:LemA protein|nr:LemA family protein [Desulfovibrionaceae bacterium]